MTSRFYLSIALGTLIPLLGACSDPTIEPDIQPPSVAGTWVGSFQLPSIGATFEAEFLLIDEPEASFSGSGEFRWQIEDIEGGWEPGEGSWEVTIVGLRARNGEKISWQGIGGERYPLVRDWTLWLRWTEVMVNDGDDRIMQTVIGGGAPASGNFGQLRGTGSVDSLVLQSIMSYDINPQLPQQECQFTAQCYQMVMVRQ